ncbi:hypothetical protein [Arachidicoccus sp.]|uniref:hypothetical protein n=1 Tax=Arachidicoccus sp. TaxID=1872624 RepID=UPI003D1B76C2
MKYLLVVCTMMFFFGSTQAQTYDSVPPYQKDSTLPKFLLLRQDSTWFNTAQIPKHTPVVITFFNPSCEHCEHEATVLSKQMNKLKNVYFVWATYEGSFAEIDTFAKRYHLAEFKNIHFVKDVNFLIPSFYRLRMTPYMVAYNKHGRLIKTWETGASPEELIKMFH